MGEQKKVDESADIKREALIAKINSLSNWQILCGGNFEFEYGEYYGGKGYIAFGTGNPPTPPPPPPPPPDEG